MTETVHEEGTNGRGNGPPGEFLDEGRNAAYNCFSSGHKFCREVCPVTQVTSDERPHPDRVPRERRRDGQGPSVARGRRRRLRPLHAARRLRAPLSEHALHGELPPVPAAHDRRRQGDPRKVAVESGRPPAELAALGRAHRPLGNRAGARLEHRATGAPSKGRAWASSASTSRPAARRCSSADCEAAFDRLVPPPRRRAHPAGGRASSFGFMGQQWCCGGPTAGGLATSTSPKMAPSRTSRDWRKTGTTRAHRQRPARLHHDRRALSARTSAMATTSSRSCSGVDLVAELSGTAEADAVRRPSSGPSPTTICAGSNKRHGKSARSPREILRAIPGLTFRRRRPRHAVVVLLRRRRRPAGRASPT